MVLCSIPLSICFVGKFPFVVFYHLEVNIEYIEAKKIWTLIHILMCHFSCLLFLFYFSDGYVTVRYKTRRGDDQFWFLFPSLFFIYGNFFSSHQCKVLIVEEIFHPLFSGFGLKLAFKHDVLWWSTFIAQTAFIECVSPKTKHKTKQNRA